jgi:hypothetical protein
VESEEQRRAYLERLADELSRREFTAQLVTRKTQLHLIVANPDNPGLSERVLCYSTPGGSWHFWWPWRQPIGAVDDLETVADKITVVLRSVEGQS